MRVWTLFVPCSVVATAFASAASAQSTDTTRLHAPTVNYGAPFVEPVHVIHEWDGESAGDQFGWIARDIGDVDGDSVHDVVISAPTRASGAADGANAGRVYVYSGRTGAMLWFADGRPGDFLGMGVESAGDVDGDGIPDVVASAQGSSEVYVYSGRDGRVILTLRPDRPGGRFGAEVAGIGDVDGDGHADIIVGAPTSGSEAADSTGRVQVFSGRTGAVLLTVTGERAGDAFGSAVAGATVGGRAWLVVGAPKAGAHRTGRIYVYDALTTAPKFVIDADGTGAAFGAMFLSVPGDLDGDGVPDVFATDFPNSARGAATGRAYVFSGATGRAIYTFTGDHAGDGFGIGRATAGDVDGDGRPDLVVGAWRYGATAPLGGRVYLYSGRDGRLLRTFTGKIAGETLGFDAVGIGDVDGDGTVDLLVTSAWSGIHGTHSGRVYIVSSGVPVRSP